MSNHYDVFLINECGEWLSLITECIITLADNRPAYKCKCGIYFPFYLVYQKDEKEIIELHNSIN